MMFKPGDIAKTRDGREVKILCVDAPSKSFPIVAMYLEDGCVLTRTAEGKCYPNSTELHEKDLLPSKRTREVKVWVNIQDRSDEAAQLVFNSEAEAKRFKYDDTIAVAVPHTFTLEW